LQTLLVLFKKRPPPVSELCACVCMCLCVFVCVCVVFVLFVFNML